MNRRQIRFVAEYFRLDKNAVEAYALVYERPTETEEQRLIVSSNVNTLLSLPEVKESIKQWEFLIAKGTRLDLSDFHAEVARLAMADARDIMGYYVGACRYCYGNGYRYQRTPAEFEYDFKKHIQDMDRAKVPDPMGLGFDPQGGMGFNPKKQPVEECPECHGDGMGYEVFNDTRYLTPGAARMFDGIKRTKDGLEIKVRSRDKMLLAAAQAIGAIGSQGRDGETGAQIVEVRGGLPDDTDRAVGTTNVEGGKTDTENAPDPVG